MNVNSIIKGIKEKIEMKDIKKGYRMYFFVPYNLLDIQKGIQAGHCAEQYALNMFNLATKSLLIEQGFPKIVQEWKDYVTYHKTWVVLNGGTFNDSYIVDVRGSMNVLLDKIEEQEIEFATFREPDLNNGLSGICFICDEKVWDWENYPHWNEYINQKKWEHAKSGLSVYIEWPEEPTDEYIEMVGGPKNWFKKQLIYKKKLA